MRAEGRVTGYCLFLLQTWNYFFETASKADRKLTKASLLATKVIL